MNTRDGESKLQNDNVQSLYTDTNIKPSVKKKVRMFRNQMLRREDREFFIEDEKKEIKSGFDTGCLSVAENVPADAKIFGLTWVYKIKPPTELEPKRYRSRLCVQGNKQTSDSYGETFAAVSKVKTFRTLVSVCVYLGLKMTQLDVSNAFMYAD